MQQLNISLEQLQQALNQNNENRGAGFIEDNGQQLTVRILAHSTTFQILRIL